MPRKQKKYHFIYKTTCKVTGKYYIGMHSTNSLEDGYLGSGKRLRYSTRKYGEENHKREIIEFVDSRKKLKQKERQIVNLNEIAKKGCMNLTIGGCCFTIDAARKGGVNSNKVLRERILNDAEFNKYFRNQISKGLREWYKNGGENPFFNKKHTEESKKMIGKKTAIHQKGKGNSQYGTCWIYSEKLKENKKIKKEELNKYLDQSWIKGRKINDTN